MQRDRVVDAVAEEGDISAGGPLRPAARLVKTTAGSCGEIPTAIASENSSASSTG